MALSRPYAVLVLAALGGLTQAAKAQQKGKGCSIDENKPSTFGKANVTMQLARGQKESQRPAALQGAIKALTSPEALSESNQAGRNLILGKALITYLSLPAQPTVVKRGAVGYASAPDQTIDLLAAADSALSFAEKVDSACVSETRVWRQQAPWQTLINAAVEQFNGDHPDSAVALANRSLVIFRGSPFAYTILGAVAQNRKDMPNAIAYRKKVVELSGSDTTYAQQRHQALLQLGTVNTDLADAATGDQKKVYAREAAKSLQALLAEAPSDPNAAYARTTLARALAIAGDTAAMRASYAAQLASPDKYEEGELLTAAVSAARADQAKDAAELFNAVLKRNPNSRDALYNAAASYNAMGTSTDSAARFEAILPLARKLVTLEPNSAEDYRLFAYAYQGLAKATRMMLPKPAGKGAPTAKAGAKKKGAAKAGSDTLVRLLRQQNDSLVKYFDISEKLTPVIRIQEFTRVPGKNVLAGTLENRGDGPKTFTINVEFLDRSGAVIGTKDASVGPVAAKGTAKFSVQSDAKDAAAAYRYKKIS
ncbi:MAG: hypothetical protein NVS4B3_07320 [Gemmatimonadaceae bacterium]